MSLQLSRRQVLTAGAVAGAGVAAGLSPAALLQALAAGPASATLADIKHVVFLIQENRSFDHYFGRYKGVRGFADSTAPGGAAAFAQAYTAVGTGFNDPLLPWHINTAVSLPRHQGQCTNDIEHQWAGQHESWHGGANDNWMNSHIATEPDALQAAVTMGYYEREDLPFYYQLADTFTICDNYFCSVIAGTDVNRLYSMTGTLDPDGWDGGCQFLNTKTGPVTNPGANLGTAGKWKPYPQVLEQSGISWKCYGTADGQTGDNALRFFPQFRPGSSNVSLATKAFASNGFPADFAADCQAGTLPQVSWIFTGLADTEHAPDPVKWGEAVTHEVLAALATSGAWQNTVLFLTYDENGGFFDHVPPPTPPAGTPGEFLNQAALTGAARTEATTVKGVDRSAEPIGLGFRVPMLVISPFTRNDPSGPPLVCSDVFDHTSMLRFVETWAAAMGTPAPVPRRDPVSQTPGLSDWRMATVGDLTSAFNFAASPDASQPTALLLNVPDRADPAVLNQCVVTGTIGSLNAETAPIVQDPSVPSNATLPGQEPAGGPVKRPSGPVAPVNAPEAPWAPALVGVAAVAAGAAWWARRREAVAAEEASPNR